jgi:hypothetical protein
LQALIIQALRNLKVHSRSSLFPSTLHRVTEIWHILLTYLNKATSMCWSFEDHWKDLLLKNVFHPTATEPEIPPLAF